MQSIFRMMVIGFTLLGSPVCAADQVFEADYVVVGMGAAGAEITKLLSDNHDFSVIGLEAGANHDHDEVIRNSQFAPVLEEDFFPQYFYQLNQVVQEGAPDVEFNYTTGRLFGGGTSINGQQYVEGTNQLYAKWQKLLGDFWSVEKIRKAFKEVETYYGRTTQSEERGKNGAVDVKQTPKKSTSMARKFVQAVTDATGFEKILDYNAPDTELGPFTRWQLTQKPDGNRESSSTAFLAPILDKHNHGKDGRQLQILDKATVLRVLFDNDKRAIGVTYLREGEFGTAYARKKVILSAGVYSAWLLQNSGIGPKDVLEEAHVEVLVDNPNVGENLVNQLSSAAVFTANPDDVGVPACDPNALYVGGAFLPAPDKSGDPEPEGLRGVQLIGVSPSPGLFTIAILPLQPKSRGNVVIQSNDPLQVPLVNDNAFSDPADMETFKDIFRVYIKSIAEKLHDIDPQYNLVAPPVEVIDDDAALEQYILTTLGHTHHWTGTCQMGPCCEKGVVDKFGNVFKVKGLVVADDSIAPFIPDGNTQGCAYMIGRRVARHIIKHQNDN